MSFSELNQKVTNDREFAELIVDLFKNQLDFYKGVNDLLRQSQVLAMVALAKREDPLELMPELNASEKNH